MAYVYVSCCAACLLTALYCVHLALRVVRAFRKISPERGLAYGSIVTGTGREFPVTELTMREEAFVASFAIFPPFEGGPQVFTLTGTDGSRIGSVDVDLPAHMEGRAILASVEFHPTGHAD